MNNLLGVPLPFLVVAALAAEGVPQRPLFGAQGDGWSTHPLAIPTTATNAFALYGADGVADHDGDGAEDFRIDDVYREEAIRWRGRRVEAVAIDEEYAADGWVVYRATTWYARASVSRDGVERGAIYALQSWFDADLDGIVDADEMSRDAEPRLFKPATLAVGDAWYNAPWNVHERVADPAAPSPHPGFPGTAVALADDTTGAVWYWQAGEGLVWVTFADGSTFRRIVDVPSATN